MQRICRFWLEKSGMLNKPPGLWIRLLDVLSVTAMINGAIIFCDERLLS